MKIAIYSRKSKYTGKGESVENQIQMCQEYIKRKIDVPEDELSIETFEDEGFSGKSLDRPQFQRMMSIARKRGFDYIICYRLDRVSRSVSDFSKLIEELNRFNTSFVCIKEEFDTSTPMGRAMMYIASVFAQLERETIAERIRDNLLLLARTGRWLGGMTPLGFESTKISQETEDGKIKTMFKLTPIPEEIETVKLIFEKYLELRSLTKVETYLMNREIKTRQNKYYSLIAVREILTNPVYCWADQKAYSYFKKLDADICYEKKEFNGKHGIAVFNRTSHTPARQNKNDPSDWIVSIGKHEGIIDSVHWIKVQQAINLNKHKTLEKRVNNPISLLSGLLICDECGSFMRPRVNSNKGRNQKGEQTYSYLCELKKRSNGEKCNSLSIHGNELDQRVVMEVLEGCQEGDSVYKSILSLKQSVPKTGKAVKDTAQILRSQIDEKDRMITNCMMALGRYIEKNPDDTAAIDRVNSEISNMANDIEEMKQKLQEQVQEEDEDTKTDSSDSIWELSKSLESVRAAFFSSPVYEKREFLRTVIDKVIWDGNNAHIYLNTSES